MLAKNVQELFMNINEIHETVHECCNVHENLIHEHDEYCIH